MWEGLFQFAGAVLYWGGIAIIGLSIAKFLFEAIREWLLLRKIRRG